MRISDWSSDVGSSDLFVIADIPGLIEGAHQGHGLGDRFLGHVERCRVPLHLVDGTAEDVAGAYRTVRRELEAYGGGLPEKAEVVGLNKCHTTREESEAEKTAILTEVQAIQLQALSGRSGQGGGAVLHVLTSHARG